eukprot:8395323-Alexandrium_andersonii.AAC.1
MPGLEDRPFVQGRGRRSVALRRHRKTRLEKDEAHGSGEKQPGHCACTVRSGHAMCIVRHPHHLFLLFQNTVQ